MTVSLNLFPRSSKFRKASKLAHAGESKTVSADTERASSRAKYTALSKSLSSIMLNFSTENSEQALIASYILFEVAPVITTPPACSQSAAAKGSNGICLSYPPHITTVLFPLSAERAAAVRDGLESIELL